MWVLANLAGLSSLCLRQRLKLKVLYKLSEGSLSLVICQRPLRINAGFLEYIFWDSMTLLCAVFPSACSCRPSPQNHFPLQQSQTLWALLSDI